MSKALASKVAEEVLGRYGADLASAVRGPSYTNEVWLTDTLAVRVATAAATGDLLREARLAALLPPEVGYPAVLDSGESHGLQWVLSDPDFSAGCRFGCAMAAKRHERC